MKIRINNYLISLLILLVSIFFFSACQKQKKVENINSVVNSYIDMWNTGNLIAIDSIVTQNFELRIDPTFQPLIGIDSLKKTILDTRKMFPDFTVNVTQKIQTGDTVLLATWTIKGTYSGENRSSLAGKSLSVPGFSVIFFSGDKISGEWIAYSDLTFMKQLGFTLVPLQESKK